MPADEFNREHFQALRTMVEVASDSHPEGSFEYKMQEKAYEGLSLLLADNPSFKELSESDRRLFGMIKNFAEFAHDQNEINSMLESVRERLTRE